MKKLLLLLILSCFSAAGFTQTTYYWVSGSGTFSALNGANWSTTPGGSPAVTRSATTDILVFDGVEVIIDLPSSASIGKLEVKNNADLTIRRSTTSATGTSTLTLNGVANAGLLVDNAKLRITGDGSYAAILTFALTSTGTVANNGEVYVTGTASNRITVPAISALTFETGTKAYVNSAGNPFNNNTNSVDFGVRFRSGSSLYYRGGLSPQGNTSAGRILNMEKGSNFVMETSYSTSINMFSGKSFSNVIIRNNSTVTLAENFYRMDNLTIEPGSSFYIRSTGTSPILGNIVNNGTFGSAPTVSSSQLVMIGVGPQSIGGSGTFANLGGLIVGTDSEVTLGTSLNLVGSSTASITGLLNTGVYSLTGSASLQFRGATLVNSNTANLVAGNNVISFANSTDYDAAGPSIGLKVVGTGIPADTYIIATSSSSFQVTLSNAPTATISGAALTFSSGSPTLRTALAGGANSAIQVAPALSYGSNTNFIFDTATTTPFPTNTSSGSIVYGNVTFNAAATTNRTVTINGKLTLNNNNLTIREGDVLTMGAGATFDSGMGANAYVVTSANSSTGDAGKIKLTDVATNVLIPVGTATSYLPVSLNPTSASTFEINVFAGATADGTPNGTALTAAQKLRMVDVVWNINRTSGSGNANVILNWPSALEGVDFSSFGNTLIGAAVYSSGAFGTFSGTGDAAANSVTLNAGTFGAFIVGEANTTLPLTLISFSGKQNLNTVKLDWKTTDEKDLKSYILQHKTGNGYVTIYNGTPNNKPGIFNYSFVHATPSAGTNYYRLLAVDLDDTTQTFDESVRVSLNNEMSIYPNPAVGNSITISGVAKGDVIKLQNIQGQLITKKIANGNIEQIDVQSIAVGTYIISVENEGKTTSSKKVIKI